MAPSDAYDHTDYFRQVLNPIAVTAWPAPKWGSIYDEIVADSLALENMRFETETIPWLGPINMVQFTVRNVGDTTVYNYVVYVNEVA